MPNRLDTDPLRNFRFHVNVMAAPKGPQLLQAGFVACSGLAVSMDPFRYQEGGFNESEHKLPSVGQWSPLTFSRGVLVGNHDEGALWFRNAFTAGGTNVGGAAPALFAPSCVVEVGAHPSPTFVPKLRFNVFYAWCSGIDYSDLDAGGNGLMVERMVVQHLGWNVSFP